MDNNAQLISDFYTCFQKKDYAGMMAVYHPEVEFSDPVFGKLKGKQAGAMWHMLCERGQDMTLQFRDFRAQGNTGQAHWEATYTFSTTGRKVHNVIDATFGFQMARSSAITTILICGDGHGWRGHKRRSARLKSLSCRTKCARRHSTD